MKKTLIVLTFFLLSACSTYKFSNNSENSNSTLTVGKISLYVTESGDSRIPKGEYTWGMTIHFKNLLSGEVIKVKDIGYKGYFYTYQLSPGTYSVEKVIFKQLYGNSIWGKLSSESFEIYDEKVNNLGHLQWATDLAGHDSDFLAFDQHDDIKKFFTKENRSSTWLNKDWIETKRLHPIEP